jgi:N-acetylneuraminic acid mutarotase
MALHIRKGKATMTAPTELRRHSSVIPLVFTSLLLLSAAGCGSGVSSGSSGGGTGTPPPTNAKEWTWVSGSNQVGAASVYGTEGVASSANVPGARAYSVSWVDSSDNLWLFGSGSYGALSNTGPSNDLWEYNLASKEWTWVSGSDAAPGNQFGVYGTEGTAASGNVPGGRCCGVSWIDTNGNLWLFGGAGYDSIGQNNMLNDLWEFDPASKQWTWQSGSDRILGEANYGSLGAIAATNVPGARQNAVSWTDSSGNFWLFGGQGNDAIGDFGSFNDLWEFNPANKEWTWVSGSTGVDAEGVYGSQGTAASGNIPGARYNAVSWADKNGNLWLFGGAGYDSTGSEYDLNDLWEFNTSSKEWTWVTGSSAVTGVAAGNLCLGGVYGTQGAAASSNMPGGRNGAASWADASGGLWLFGGLGCDSSGTAGSLNDLWEFNSTSKTWTWMSGSNSVGPAQGGTGGPSGVYGTEGTPAAANVPGGRDNSISWIDSSGTFWLFGGIGHDSTGASGGLSDLWSYTP